MDYPYPVKTVDQLAPLLKAFRRTAGLTQADLAARLGITQQTYARLEANPKVVSLARFLRVLALLDVQMALGTVADTPENRTATRQRKVKGVAAKAKSGPSRSAPAAKLAAKVTRAAGKSAAKPAEKQPKPVISKRERW